MTRKKASGPSPTNPEVVVPNHTLDILDALRADPAIPYSKVGERFGVSREAVRQTAKRHLNETGTFRALMRAVVRDEKLQAELATRSIPGRMFTCMVRRWLMVSDWGLLRYLSSGQGA
jgi:hypothetical protein